MRRKKKPNCKKLAEVKEAQETALAARESVVAAQEAETAELRKKVAAFPGGTGRGRVKAEKEATARAENRAKVEAQLCRKAIEGDKRVAELKIKGLEETVAKQLVGVQALTRQLNDGVPRFKPLLKEPGCFGAKALSAINENRHRTSQEPEREDVGGI